jgi:hypothetical protein
MTCENLINDYLAGPQALRQVVAGMPFVDMVRS